MGDIYEFYSGPFGNIRIPIPDATSLDYIKTRVARIRDISKKKYEDEITIPSDEGDADISRIRLEIDAIVFSLFSLTLEEINFILDVLGKGQRNKDAIMSNKS